MSNHSLQIKILSFIAKIIHPKVSKKNLFDSNNNNQKFWEKFVKISSNHLLIPAIYGSIIRKNIEEFFPDDLLEFLEEIYNINTKRNNDILIQINFISNLFRKNKINHIFIKGSALLISQAYNAKEERMVGDIDILVKKKDLLIANDILINNGFIQSEDKILLLDGIFEKRHLKRLVHNRFIAAVELHSNILENRFSHFLSTDELFEKKCEVKNISIPCKTHLWKNAILNWQYNDKGLQLNYLGFNAVLDVINLEPELNKLKKIKFDNATKHFYSLLSLFMDFYPDYDKISKTLYYLRINNKYLNEIFKIFYAIKIFLYIVFNRFNLFLKSKIYRKRIIYNIPVVLKKVKFFWRNFTN